jgi:hypothetical protein
VKFICEVRNNWTPPCGESFDTFEELAEHINIDHRCLVKIRMKANANQSSRGDARTRDESRRATV